MTRLARLFRRKPCRYHHRSTGPVVINPDRAEVVHVWGQR